MAARTTASAPELREFVRRLNGGESLSSIARNIGRPRPTLNSWKAAYESGSLSITEDSVTWAGVLVEGDETQRHENKKKLAESRATIKQHEERIAQLEEMLADARKPRVSYKAHQAPLKKNSFNRVFVTDSHGEKVDKVAFEAFLADLERVSNIHEIVIGGDMLDCDGFLSSHVPQYLPQFDYSFEEDVAAANEQLDQIQKRCPKAKMYYLEGNHEHRVERWLAKQMMGNARDANYLYRLMGPKTALNLEKRGIEFFSQGGQHMGMKVRGTIKLGHCYFQHGTGTSSRTASYKNLHKFAACLIHGHNHSMQQASTTFMDGEPVMAACPGCLCQMHPMYNHSDPCSWTHGYGLQPANRDGTFHYLPVPIVNKQSVLQYLWN